MQDPNDDPGWAVTFALLGLLVISGILVVYWYTRGGPIR